MSMNTSQYSNKDYFTLLALHMPALTPAMGRPEGSIIIIPNSQNIDMVKSKDGWGRNHFEYKTRWLHSDIKNMAYFYIKPLFEQFKRHANGE